MSRAGQQGIAQWHSIPGGADNFDKLMFGHCVTGFAAQDVIKAGLGATLVPQAQKVLQGIGNLPTGLEVH